eukprot:TRINITY_DN14884_c0_g2_i1.p1 TRINITY_DN14884_c0_g2~~TRINITY_DN14884_c0_g2_i1.p1  ORF type:complete len:710 (+),score=113.27 TRINITY_DN14884_c0_g2_i1:43-2130(+)
MGRSCAQDRGGYGSDEATPPRSLNGSAECSVEAKTSEILRSLRAPLQRSLESLLAARQPPDLQATLDRLSRENSELKIKLSSAAVDRAYSDADAGSPAKASGGTASTPKNEFSPDSKSSKALGQGSFQLRAAPRQSQGEEETGRQSTGELKLRGSWTTNVGTFRKQRSLGILSDAQQEAERAKKCYILSPASRWFLCWQLLFTLVLAYELLSFPMGAFDIPPTAFSEAIVIFNVLFWSCDMVLTFFVGYYTRDGELIMTPGGIAIRYMKTWLLPDLVVILTDWVGVLGVGGSGTRSIKLIRFMRVGRVLRLLRLRKLKEMLRTLDDYLSSEYVRTLRSLLLDMTAICVASHFLGCLLFLIGTIRIEGYDNWVTRYKMDDVHWSYAYLTSWHWSVCQFTPGSNEIQPQNPFERAFNILMLVMGMVIFSTVLGNITLAMKTLRHYESKFDNQLAVLRRYFKQTKLSTQLLHRVSVYSDSVVKPKLYQVQLADVTLLARLPVQMRREVFMELRAHYLVVHPLLHVTQVMGKHIIETLCDGVTESSLSTRAHAFSPGEAAKEMFFVTYGKVKYIMQTEDDEDEVTFIEGGTSASSYFLEVVLWTPWICRGVAAASTDSELMSLGADVFQGVFSLHPGLKWLPMTYGLKFVEEVCRRSDAGEVVSDLIQVEAAVESLPVVHGNAVMLPSEWSDPEPTFAL